MAYLKQQQQWQWGVSMAGERDLGKMVSVPLWVVVMAIRYGTGRMTYANNDAAMLARDYWTMFPTFIRQQIREDAERLTSATERFAWYWLLEKGEEG